MVNLLLVKFHTKELGLGMARITKEERDKKKARFDQIVWDVFAMEGWEAITYQRVADEAGVSRSALQRYYPNQLDFLEAIEGKTLGQLSSRLDTQCPSSFLASWVGHLQTPLFRNSFQLIVNDAVNGLNGKHSIAAVSNLRGFITDHFGEENAEPLLWQAIGGLVVGCAEGKQP